MLNAESGPALSDVRQGAGSQGPEAESDAHLLRRFARRQDQAAFAALVERHGPMVLRVCRRVLASEQDAEDAFQGTFLVLVRKAGSIARPELLANWLYGVAYRVAAKVRSRSVLRRACELRAASLTPAACQPEEFWPELARVLDEEMSGLPEKYRAPLVLCYLEGKTNLEAARQLGWPAGSMSRRLARGRELLRRRLSRRGFGMSAVGMVLLLTREAGPAGLPAPLFDGLMKMSLAFVTGGTPPGAVAVYPVSLAEAMLRGMFARRLRVLAAVALALLLGGTASAVAGYRWLILPAGSQAHSASGGCGGAAKNGPG
jgi:RNA polymerase sigma factor (sigma-70 family)